MRSITFTIVALISSLTISGCQKDIECFTSTEGVTFSLVTPKGKPILTKSDTQAVEIIYRTANNNSIQITDLIFSENVIEDLYTVTSNEMVRVTPTTSPQAFTLVYQQQPLGEIILEAQEESNPCQPWYSVSSFTFESKPVGQNAVNVYLIEIDQ